MNVHLDLFRGLGRQLKNMLKLHTFPQLQVFSSILVADASMERPHTVQLELYLARGDCLATLARRQAAQHFEVLQQQQKASHCRLPAVQLASRESFRGGGEQCF